MTTKFISLEELIIAITESTSELSVLVPSNVYQQTRETIRFVDANSLLEILYTLKGL